MMKVEMWDIYTKDRVKTGRLHQRGQKLLPGDYHLVVAVCVFNQKGELLLQQRQPFKQGYPNMWDISAVGSALAGESSSEAAERETEEEIGLKLDLSDQTPVFTLYRDDNFFDFYCIQKEVDVDTLSCQKEEVKQVRWFRVDEMHRMQENGTMAYRWFLEGIEEILSAARGDSRRMQKEIRIQNAAMLNLESWMSLIEIIRPYFPGFETETMIQEHRDTVQKDIEKGTAVCAICDRMVVGALLFSPETNHMDFLAVNPEFSRRGIASGMLELAYEKLDMTRDIILETFREEDEYSDAPRAFYKKLGYEPDRLTCYCREGREYPVQRFVKRGH